MSAVPVIVPDISPQPRRAPRAQVAMSCLIAAESAIFTIFVVAYLFYMGKSLNGPAPKDILTVPVFMTICLLSSSLTIHLATKSLRRGEMDVFVRWWSITIMLGAAFLAGTAEEWRHLIYDKGFTVQTNLFGTTYYSLVGLHAFHVTAGVVCLLTVWVFAFRGHLKRLYAEHVDVLALYWHFVDAVWVVVFLVVYVIGR